MESPSKPVSLLCLKVLMQYMEANKRYALAAHCPALRPIHQRIPLTVEHLKINDFSVTINNYRHEFHSFMEHPWPGYELPVDLQVLNLHGGKPYELNQYGEKDVDEDLEPGDVKFSSEPHPEEDDLEEGYDDDYQMRQMERPRRFPGRDYSYQEHRPPSPEIEPPPPKQSELPRKEYFPYVKFSLQYLPKPTPYLLQKQIRFPIGVKIRDALRQHLSTIFNAKTLIKHLEIDQTRGILRIPAGLKFRIQNLTVTPQALGSIQKMINWEESHLKTLTTTMERRFYFILRNKKLRSFPSLNLKQIEESGIWMRKLENISSTEIYITNFMTSLLLRTCGAGKLFVVP